MTMTATVVAPGQVRLAWTDTSKATSVLIVRSGAKPSFTALRLAAGCAHYTVTGLARHQRYQFAVLKGQVASEWHSVMPNVVSAPVSIIAESVDTVIAGVHECFVMPQDGRLTVFWRLGVGFADHVEVVVREGTRVVRQQRVPAEVASVAVSDLSNGTLYSVSVTAGFADLHQPSVELHARPAPLGVERACNAGLHGLLFLLSTLAPEADCFSNGPAAVGGVDASIVCGECQAHVRWDAREFRCGSCGSVYVRNALGDYLNVASLRFGTCECCVPAKILIQRQSDAVLRCCHSQKEHLRDGGRYLLIEDLPFGLCQCCRPRRPLIERAGEVRCAKTNETHQRDGVSYVLAPSQDVFDASSIDALLDAGLAEISATGISHRRVSC